MGHIESIALNINSYQTQDGQSHFPSCELSFSFLQKVLGCTETHLVFFLLLLVCQMSRVRNNGLIRGHENLPRFPSGSCRVFDFFFFESHFKLNSSCHRGAQLSFFTCECVFFSVMLLKMTFLPQSNGPGIFPESQWATGTWFRLVFSVLLRWFVHPMPIPPCFIAVTL